MAPNKRGVLDDTTHLVVAIYVIVFVHYEDAFFFLFPFLFFLALLPFLLSLLLFLIFLCLTLTEVVHDCFVNFVPSERVLKLLEKLGAFSEIFLVVVLRLPGPGNFFSWRISPLLEVFVPKLPQQSCKVEVFIFTYLFKIGTHLFEFGVPAVFFHYIFKGMKRTITRFHRFYFVLQQYIDCFLTLRRSLAARNCYWRATIVPKEKAIFYNHLEELLLLALQVQDLPLFEHPPRFFGKVHEPAWSVVQPFEEV
mmetsp:Transcript_70214/g.139006  ORF Transcript_70214/g.139006 Transcript_70214/m.139006 type:complete len:252 (-) Transcript_70214:410-1165(-)